MIEPLSGLRLGLIEAANSSEQIISFELISENGPYGDAHKNLAEQFSTGCYRSLDRNLLPSLKATAVFQCESAKRWLADQVSGKFDYWTTRVQEGDARSEALARAVLAVDQLIAVDCEQPYWLRQVFTRALVSQAPKGVGFDAFFSDANHPDGGVRVQLTSEEREALEPQLLAQIGISKLDLMLAQFRDDLKTWAERKPAPWNWIGNLYVTPALTRRARGAISRNGNTPLGIATLGLTAALSSWFRAASLNEFPGRRYAGELLATTGRPNWSLVSDYVGIALPSTDTVSPESIRQRWSNFAKNREIRLHLWPETGIRQSQIVSNISETD